MARRFAFTGSQAGMNNPQLRVLRTLYQEMFQKGFFWQENGLCIGADEQSAKAWIEMGGLCHFRPSNIKAKTACFSAPGCRTDSLKRPPLERNRIMVRHAEVLIATPNTLSEAMRSGTWATIRFARIIGVPRRIILPNGHLIEEVG